MSTKTDAFILGYLHKVANTNQNVQPAYNGQLPNAGTTFNAGAVDPATVPNQFQQTVNNWATGGMDPTHRALGEGGAAAALGAGLGGMMGGTGGAAMGAGLGGLLYYLANTFFGQDMDQARNWINSKIQNGTLPETLTKLKKDNPALSNVDEKAVQAEAELEGMDAKINSTDNPAIKAELLQNKVKMQEAAGQDVKLNPALDANQNGISDAQEMQPMQGTSNRAKAYNASMARQQAPQQPTTPPQQPMQGTSNRAKAHNARVTRQQGGASGAAPGKPQTSSKKPSTP